MAQHEVDPVIMMDMFINLLPEDSELQHKSFYTKLKRRVRRHLKRFDQRYIHSRSVAIRKAFVQIDAKDNPAVSVAPLLGAIYTKHSEYLESKGILGYWISQTNEFVGGQGVTLASAKVVRLVEEGL